MKNLNNPTEILEYAGESVITSVNNLPEQLLESFDSALQIEYGEKYKKVKNILVCGMGGSRFPALILQYLYKDKLKVPLIINDDYTLPHWVNDETLVVLSSYSGTTDEVISCGNEAVGRNLTVTGLAHGGKIIEILQTHNLPHYQFDAQLNPSTQPRIGFGYTLGGLLGILVNLGLVDVSAAEIQAACQHLMDTRAIFAPASETAKNPAKQIAEKLYHRYPYFIVGDFLSGIGNAMQNQINETAKSISSFRVIPELNHHLMEGLKFPEEHKKIALFVLCYSDLFPAEIQKRFHITREIIEQNAVETLWVETLGTTKIQQALYLMLLGSYTSLYLSILHEQDANAIPFVDYFKMKMRG